MKQGKLSILEKGFELVSSQGLAQTGVGDILRFCQIPKGSFYHYFSSKDEFALELIDYAFDKLKEELDKAFLKSSQGPLRKLELYLNQEIEKVEKGELSLGYFFGALGQELSDKNKELNQKIAAVFEKWQEFFYNCLKDAQSNGQVDTSLKIKSLAIFIHSGWEGALLQSKVAQNPEYLREFKRILFARVLKSPD